MLKDKIFGSFGLSMILHVVVLSSVLVTVGLKVTENPIIDVNLHPDAPENQTVIKAGVVDTKAIDQAYQRQVKAEKLRKQNIADDKRRAEQLKKQAADAKKALAVANAKKAAVQAESKALKVQQEKAKKELAAQKVQQEKAQQDKARLELAKKQEAEKKAAALKADKARLQALRDTFIMDEVMRYTSEFAQVIEENRILSSVFKGDMLCQLRIRLLPDGSIMSVSILESSGNSAYDDMSANAVHKSSPFSMPEDEEVYKKVSDIVLSFKNGDQNVS